MNLEKLKMTSKSTVKWRTRSFFEYARHDHPGGVLLTAKCDSLGFIPRCRLDHTMLWPVQLASNFLLSTDSALSSAQAKILPA